MYLFFFFLSFQRLANHSSHGSLHSLDTEVVAGGPLDPYKENLRRVQSTDSLGSSLSVQQGLGGHNHKAKSASHLDESDFGPLVGADCVGADSSFGETSSISSIKLTASHFLLTKDQEKAIKAMTPEQEETASLLSSISHAPDTAFLPPAGYRLVSDSEWNLLQQEVLQQFIHPYIHPCIALGVFVSANCFMHTLEKCLVLGGSISYLFPLLPSLMF